jgi:hypothetical protein
MKARDVIKGNERPSRTEQIGTNLEGDMRRRLLGKDKAFVTCEGTTKDDGTFEE